MKEFLGNCAAVILTSAILTALALIAIEMLPVHDEFYAKVYGVEK